MASDPKKLKELAGSAGLNSIGNSSVLGGEKITPTYSFGTPLAPVQAAKTPIDDIPVLDFKQHLPAIQQMELVTPKQLAEAAKDIIKKHPEWEKELKTAFIDPVEKASRNKAGTEGNLNEKNIAQSVKGIAESQNERIERGNAIRFIADDTMRELVMAVREKLTPDQKKKGGEYLDRFRNERERSDGVQHEMDRLRVFAAVLGADVPQSEAPKKGLVR